MLQKQKKIKKVAFLYCIYPDNSPQSFLSKQNGRQKLQGGKKK